VGTPPLWGQPRVHRLLSTISPTTLAAASRAATLPELCFNVWALIAEQCGFVGAFRLMLLCKTAREGAKVWLRSLPRLVLCGGFYHEDNTHTPSSEVWRLNLGPLRWDRMSDLTRARGQPACCAVRGGVAVFGGVVEDSECTAGVEILEGGPEAEANGFKALPPLSRGPVHDSVAISIDESESEQGRVFLIGADDVYGSSPAVHKVDLATGACSVTALLSPPVNFFAVTAAARLLDGRIVCASETFGDDGYEGSVEVLEPSEQGSTIEASGQWRALPFTIIVRHGIRGCVLSDGRFAIFGGSAGYQRVIGGDISTCLSSCEVLTLDPNGDRWDMLPPMREARNAVVCAAIGGCVIVAGGDSNTIEVYEEELGRWRRLPRDLPYTRRVYDMGSAVM